MENKMKKQKMWDDIHGRMDAAVELLRNGEPIEDVIDSIDVPISYKSKHDPDDDHRKVLRYDTETFEPIYKNTVKVKNLIEQLKDYNPEAEVLVTRDGMSFEFGITHSSTKETAKQVYFDVDNDFDKCG